MATVNFTLQGTYTLMTCGVKGCGIAFAVDKGTHKRWRDTGEWFYCPNGHHIHYSDTETERLRREAAQKQAQIDCLETDLRRSREYADVNLRSANAYRGQVTKIKRRVAHGVCVCCKRTFQNLAAHMKGQHPDYVEAAKVNRSANEKD